MHVTPDMKSFNFASLQVKHYQAVLINTGWELWQQPLLCEASHTSMVSRPAPAVAGGLQGHSSVASWSERSCEISNSGSGSSSRQAADQLAALPVSVLCPRGFIMIWANKEHLAGEALGGTASLPV